MWPVLDWNLLCMSDWPHVCSISVSVSEVLKFEAQHPAFVSLSRLWIFYCFFCIMTIEFLIYSFLVCFSEARSCYIAPGRLKLGSLFLSQFPKYWNYKCASPRWESFGFLKVPLNYRFSGTELLLTQQLPSLCILLLFCCCHETLWARQLIGRTGFCLLLFLFLLMVPQGESMVMRRDGENAWNRKRWDHISN